MYANSFLTPEIAKERRTKNHREATGKGRVRHSVASIVTSLFGAHR